jgi:threonine dehydratase
MLTLADIQAARERIAPYCQPTLLEFAPELGDNIWLKLENTNQTHSFKIRGALNAALSLDDAARAKGLVTASSGNHAQALSYAAKIAGVKAKILIPKHTPKRKVNGVIRHGAEAVLFGDNYDETEAEALRLGREGLTFVSAYSDPKVIAGTGTIGLEILDQLPEVERVIVPVSGGGLISGIALAIKETNPAIEVIGVNAQSAPSMYNHFYGTDYQEVWETLAEALSGAIEDGSMTLELVTKYVDQIVLATEDQIEMAMRWMIDQQGWIVEGGGCVGAAALLANTIEHDGRPTAVVVSGGNVDGETIRRILRS